MKLWHIVGIMMIGLLFLYRETGTISYQKEQLRQEQEADPRIMEESIERLSYRVVYRSPDSEHDELADIHWLKKAAALALKKGHPYFNIMEQRLIRAANPKMGRGRNTVEGVIQLSPDPVGAEYDARTIKALVLANQ